VWSIGRSVTIFSSAKVAEPIEVPFGLWTRVGPRNNVLDGVQISPCTILRAKGVAHCKLYGSSAMICAKMPLPIEMPFVVWTLVGSSSHVLDVH